MSSPILRGLQGIAWLAVFMFLAPRFPGQILLSPEFKQHGFCWSAFTAAMSAFTHRSKYYGIWCLIDGACALTGLRRADVEDKKGLTWKTIQNINPYRIESAQNIRGFLCHWNMGVSNWLRHYVYTRIAEDGTRPDAKSSLGTFMILASWHGFEPGYYVAFIGAATAQIMAKG
jgi:lysophospholipid acyltransferase